MFLTKDNRIDVPEVNGYSADALGNAFIAIESLDDELELTKIIHAMDIAELETMKVAREGSEYAMESALQEYEVATEGFFSNFYDKVKKMLTSMIAKIKAFFKSVIRFFQGFILTGKKFITKYEKQLNDMDMAGKLDGHKVKTYKFTNLDGKEAADVFESARKTLHDNGATFVRMTAIDADTLTTKVEKLKEDKSDILEKVRGSMFGSGSLTSEDYNEKAFGFFRDGATGENDKEEQELSAKEVISFLKDSKVLKTAQDAEKEADKMFSAYIKELDKLRKDLVSGDLDQKGYKVGALNKPNDSEKKEQGAMTFEKAADKTRKAQISGIREIVSLVSSSKDVALSFFSQWRSAIKEKESANYKWARSAFSYKKKDK